jgi:hypothetical protein
MVRNLTDSLSSNDDRKTKEKYFDTNYTSLPLGIWGGRLGVLFRDSINELFFENIKLLKEELIEGIIPHDSDIEAMNLELDSQKAFMNLHHVYARKGSSC